jgi:hypothetical protein
VCHPVWRLGCLPTVLGEEQKQIWIFLVPSIGFTTVFCGTNSVLPRKYKRSSYAFFLLPKYSDKLFIGACLTNHF